MNPSESPRPDADHATRNLRGQRVIRPQADELIDHLAAHLIKVAVDRTHSSGVLHLALSGGSTPQRLYHRLMIDPAYRLMPWKWTHLWLVDERCVPPDDPRSNYRTIRELIVDHSDIPADQVHAMPVLESDGDRRYEQDLRSALAREGCGNRLDFVLLGMGADGHTASLFPETPALDEMHRWVVFNDGPTVAEPRPRMTMTFPLINSARHVAVLVTGESKRAALQQAALASSADGARRQLPISAVAPSGADASLTWYLDHAAALGPGR